MAIWKKLFGGEEEKERVQKTLPMKPLNYPSKIILAWAEAVSGNVEVRDWLTKNGYEELGIFVFALNNKDDARDWLMKNGYPHLMAMINGGEGNQNAVKWLFTNKLEILAYMALGIDGYQKGYDWLIKNGHKDFAFLTKQMQIVKDLIHEDNGDIHKRSAD
jgi:hypothetical protein